MKQAQASVGRGNSTLGGNGLGLSVWHSYDCMMVKNKEETGWGSARVSSVQGQDGVMKREKKEWGMVSVDAVGGNFWNGSG